MDSQAGVEMMCDCDRPEVYRQEIHVARKAHRCCECDREIKPGQRYVLHTGTWGDGWDSYKQCMRCDRLAKKLRDMDPEGCGPCLGALREYVSEHRRELRWQRERCSGLTGAGAWTS